MKLSECLVNLDYECLKGNVDNVINDVVYDSRKSKCRQCIYMYCWCCN